MKECIDIVGNILIVTLLLSSNICLWWSMVIGYKEHKEKQRNKRLKESELRRLRSQSR